MIISSFFCYQENSEFVELGSSQKCSFRPLVPSKKLVHHSCAGCALLLQKSAVAPGVSIINKNVKAKGQEILATNVNPKTVVSQSLLLYDFESP